MADCHIFSDSENDCGNRSYELNCTGLVTRVLHNDTTIVRFWLICDGINSLNLIIFTRSLITENFSVENYISNQWVCDGVPDRADVIKLPVKMMKFNEPNWFTQSFSLSQHGHLAKDNQHLLLSIHTFLHDNITSEHNTFQLINIIQLIYFKTSILLTIRVCVASRLQIVACGTLHQS